MILYDVPPFLTEFLMNNVLVIDLVHLALIFLFIFLCRKYLKNSISIDKKDIIYIAIIIMIFISSVSYLISDKKMCSIYTPDQGWYSLKIAKMMAKTGKYQWAEFSISNLGYTKECAVYVIPSRLDAVPFIYFLILLFFGLSAYINLWANFAFSIMFLIVVYLLMKFVTGKQETGLIASIAFVLSPLYLLNVFYHEIAISSFFVFLSILFIILSLRINKLYFYMLTFLLISFTAKIRPENSVMFIVFFISVLIFNRSLFRNRTFVKNISISLAIALIIGILFVTHIIFIPRFWGIEFLGPEYQDTHPFMAGVFFESLTGISSYLAEENGMLMISFLIIGILYGFLRYRKTLFLFLLAMIPYALVYLFYAFWTDRYAYHLNLFIIPITGMGIYSVYTLLYKLISENFLFRKEMVFAAIFSIAVFLLLFLPFALHKDSCEIGTIEFLEGLDEISNKFKSSDIIVTGRDDFAHIFNYLTDSCVICVAFTTDGIVIKEYEKAEWEKLESFTEGNKNMTYFVMPKKEATRNYIYYEGTRGKLSSIFDLEYEFDNKIASIYRIIPK